MNKISIIAVFLISSFFLFSCGTSSKSSNTDNEANVANQFNALVQEWNNAHSSRDAGAFSNLFDNTVLFYGMQLDKNTCVEKKLSMFRKNPDFYQQIYGDIQIDKISDTEVTCSFVKRVTVNQQTNDYPSYLTFRKSGESWKITTEGDLVTDKNLAKKSNKPQSQVSSSSGFVTGLTASRVYTGTQAENGSEYTYSDKQRFKISFYFNQVDVFFYAHNTNNERQELNTNWEVGYTTADGEIYYLKDGVKFLVGQYDFNSDGIDELIIALQDNDELDNGLSIKVFELNNNNYWQSIGSMTGKAILGEPKASVTDNKITIPRQLRGFYYQWTYENGRFKDTGYY